MLLAIAATGIAAIWLAFRSDVQAAEQRVTGKSQVVQTRHGTMEYAEQGRGPPLLMIHGTGGGFDQGLLFSKDIIGSGIRVIAPSRFGYLRSGWPADPSSERQAEVMSSPGAKMSTQVP